MPTQFDMFSDESKEVESKNDEYEEMQARQRALAAEIDAEAERVRKAIAAGEDPYPESKYVDYCQAVDYIICTIQDGDDPKELKFGDPASNREHSILEARFYGTKITGEELVNELLAGHQQELEREASKTTGGQNDT